MYACMFSVERRHNYANVSSKVFDNSL